MMKLLAGAAIAALSIAATSANAQTPPPPGVAKGTVPPPMVEPVRPVPPALVRTAGERDDVIRVEA